MRLEARVNQLPDNVEFLDKEIILRNRISEVLQKITNFQKRVRRKPKTG